MRHALDSSREGRHLSYGLKLKQKTLRQKAHETAWRLHKQITSVTAFTNKSPTMRRSRMQPGGKRTLLSRIARQFACKRRPRCAIPGCPNSGVKQKCCKQPLCRGCLAHTLRTAFDDRLRTRCPFCRKTLLRPDSVAKRLMHHAFPSHAATIGCEGGPPAVIAHLPCPKGHYECRGSTVRLLSIAQEQMLFSTQARLDLAEKKTAQLTQTIAAMRECQ